MIVTQTPLRISFFSGSSDLPSFYEKEIGAALSVTINKFVYVYSLYTQHTGIKTIFDNIEEVSSINDVSHDIAKQTLEFMGFSNNITVGSVSDIPSKGSGLGSSSAFTVGLIKPYFEQNTANIAELAFKIENHLCGFPVGKQDQYAAAFGGFNLYRFHDFGYVEIEKGLTRSWADDMESNLILVYSGKGRSANKILQKQKDAVLDSKKFELMKAGRDKALYGWKLLKDQKYDDFGDLLNEAWKEKKSIVSEVSDEYFDDIYEKAMNAGALGGKLLGAGGGGFFIFYVSESQKPAVIEAVTTNTQCKIYNFNFYNQGSKIITRN